MQYWRLINPDAIQFILKQKHASGFIQRRLDCFFISNNLQEVITHAHFFEALLTNHFSVTISIKQQKLDLWSQSLEIQQFFPSNENCIRKTKNLIQTCHSNHHFIPNNKLR